MCPVCGGDLENKLVEKLLRGGVNIVSLKVNAEVCLHCGERLFSENVVKTFVAIRTQLRKQEFDHFRILGQSFTVDENWADITIQPTVG